MNKKPKVGRNEPCPCGSGKKYKRCCGAGLRTYVNGEKEIDHFKLNKEIAYKGKVGRMREEFCKHYIRRKQVAFKAIEQKIMEQTTAVGETITCHKGCFFCCSQYVGASTKECEAIVYYLYQHENLFTDFIQAYPRWRANMRKNESLFKRIGELYNKLCAGDTKKTIRPLIDEAGSHYLAQNILCPFLDDGICSIYEVRPWVCASYFVVSPAELCRPMSTKMPKNYEVHGEWEIETLLYGKSTAFVLHPLPIGVYNILTGGIDFLSKIPGLESLEQAAINDPEVRPIIQQYLKTR